ncbi:VanZ family protein [Streptomyces tubercidicus]|uniref:hypothetical protein n=1 Tax=Streptomyces tubercidicus TaxID=47759 RepID=UPI0036BA32C8
MIRGYFGQPQPADTVKQLGGNVLLGLPFGVLLPVLVPRARSLVGTAGPVKAPGTGPG